MNRGKNDNLPNIQVLCSTGQQSSTRSNENGRGKWGDLGFEGGDGFAFFVWICRPLKGIGEGEKGGREEEMKRGRWRFASCLCVNEGASEGRREAVGDAWKMIEDDDESGERWRYGDSRRQNSAETTASGLGGREAESWRAGEEGVDERICSGTFFDNSQRRRESPYLQRSPDSPSSLIGGATNLVTGDVQGAVYAVTDALKTLNSPQIKLHRVIYHLLEDIGNSIVDKAPGTSETRVAGEAQVLNIFQLKERNKSKGEDVKIAGCRVTDGKVIRSASVKLLRSGEVIFEGCCQSLKQEKHDVEMVGKGKECGLVILDWHDFQIGDVIQCLEEATRKPKFISSDNGAVRIEC
ncbi:hypothetical protein Droror1_Dr00015066 [Drosera rotundifolia]